MLLPNSASWHIHVVNFRMTKAGIQMGSRAKPRVHWNKRGIGTTQYNKRAESIYICHTCTHVSLTQFWLQLCNEQMPSLNSSGPYLLIAQCPSHGLNQVPFCNSGVGQLKVKVTLSINVIMWCFQHFSALQSFSFYGPKPQISQVIRYLARTYHGILLVSPTVFWRRGHRIREQIRERWGYVP